jgi:hypothetical protein
MQRQRGNNFWRPWLQRNKIRLLQEHAINTKYKSMQFLPRHQEWPIPSNLAAMVPPSIHSSQARTPSSASHPYHPSSHGCDASSSFTCLREASPHSLPFKQPSRIFKTALAIQVHNTKSVLGIKSRKNWVGSMYTRFTTCTYDCKPVMLTYVEMSIFLGRSFMSTLRLSCIYMQSPSDVVLCWSYHISMKN